MNKAYKHNKKVSGHIQIVRCAVIIITGVSLLTLSLTGCKKLVEVNTPYTSTNSGNVYSNDANAIAVVTGIYAQMSSTTFSVNSSGIGTVSLFNGLSADEFNLYNGITNTPANFYYSNELTNSNAAGTDLWSAIYPIVFVTNAAIEGLMNAGSLTPAVKKQLIGEAKFMRAFCYFYLTNLYGNLPLAISTDYTINAELIRIPKDLVYQQIITDLKSAEDLLNENYVGGDAFTITTERVRPNKWTAAALLARVYLYTNDWGGAEQQATTIINNTNLFDTVSLNNNVFSKSSKEAIWQLQPVNIGQNTPDAWFFIIPPAGPNNSKPIYLSKSLLGSFEVGDQRRIDWINSVTVDTITYSYPYKYKSAKLNDPITEYSMVLRLGEQLLIRAEARAQQNNIIGATSDLNMIRHRAGLTNTDVHEKSALLAAIMHERQVELFGEWGHRWLDLKRTGTVDKVMSLITPQKGGTWNTTDQLYPIPLSELLMAPQLEQNAGY
ncbi:RagB/SusD family nutrient uptake outer membrane protein [Chitinophaga sp. MM2321]|uniref:RagB/SusD family nutrient uptake outer membrane protein n=1 Tax=Chitinophaga sp. MM2321 TaxID=3137178 RepID=UPI0032D5889A